MIGPVESHETYLAQTGYRLLREDGSTVLTLRATAYGVAVEYDPGDLAELGRVFVDLLAEVVRPPVDLSQQWTVQAGQ